MRIHLNCFRLLVRKIGQRRSVHLVGNALETGSQVVKNGSAF